LNIPAAKTHPRRFTSRAYWIVLGAILVSLNASAGEFWSLNWFAKKEPIQVTVNAAYLDVYNAPGRGYPIYHAVERGDQITLLKINTDWIKIKTARGLEGWIKRSDALLTLGPDGQAPEFTDPKKTDYLVDRIELGTAFGDFDGANSFSVNLGYRFTKNLSGELRFAQNTGEFADSQIVAFAILHQPFPEWRVSPFIGIGSGTLYTLPSTTLVESEDRQDHLLQASFGIYTHVAGRFFLRAEYLNDYILTSRNTNQEVNEWKIGFSVFF